MSGFKEVDANLVSGILRKPFEIADLGNLIRLCVSGFNEELSQLLFLSKDRAIRDFASGENDRKT